MLSLHDTLACKGIGIDNMALPPESDRKIRNRLYELILEGNNLAGIDGSVSDYEAYFTKVQSLIAHMFRGSERGRAVQDRIKTQWYGRAPSDGAAIVAGVLRGLQDDYERGFLEDLENMVFANVSSDYMVLFADLLGGGTSDDYSYAMTAVGYGIVLELGLRRLCERQSPAIATAKENGDFKKLTALIQDLRKADAFNKLKADQLGTWARVRNYAAHGQFDQFNRHDVDDMVRGVRNFLADYL